MERIHHTQIDSPSTYFQKQGYAHSLIELDSIWVGNDLIDEFQSTITEFVNEDGFIELSTVFPPSFTPKDVSLVLKQIPKLAFEFAVNSPTIYTVLGDFVVRTNLLNTIALNHLRSMESAVLNALQKNQTLESCVPSIEKLQEELREASVLVGFAVKRRIRWTKRAFLKPWRRFIKRSKSNSYLFHSLLCLLGFFTERSLL